MTDNTPPPPDIVRDLRRLVESEDLGASTFATCADTTRSDRQHRAWNALRDLEIRTKAGVDAFSERTELPIRPTNRAAMRAGRVSGTGLLAPPYSLRLWAIRESTARYLPAFHRLARYYDDTAEATFFDYVVRHELAIIEFTSNAMAGDHRALDPVLRLLDTPTPSNGTEHEAHPGPDL